MTGIRAAFLLLSLAAAECIPQFRNASCPEVKRPAAAADVPDLTLLEDVKTSVKLINMTDLLNQLQKDYNEAKEDLEKWRKARNDARKLTLSLSLAAVSVPVACLMMLSLILISAP